MELSKCLGKKYKLVKQDNFEDYLILLGKGYLARKAALSLRPVIWLTADGDSYTMHFTSPLASSVITFTPGVNFEEIKPDGVKVNSIITIEDHKLIHIQTEANGRKSKHIREFFPDKLIITTTADDFDKVATRYHELVQ